MFSLVLVKSLELKSIIILLFKRFKLLLKASLLVYDLVREEDEGVKVEFEAVADIHFVIVFISQLVVKF